MDTTFLIFSAIALIAFGNSLIRHSRLKTVEGYKVKNADFWIGFLITLLILGFLFLIALAGGGQEDYALIFLAILALIISFTKRPLITAGVSIPLLAIVFIVLLVAIVKL